MSALSLKLDTRMGRLIVLLARAIVGGLFLYAAVPKIASPGEFAQAMATAKHRCDYWPRVTGQH